MKLDTMLSISMTTIFKPTLIYDAEGISFEAVADNRILRCPKIQKKADVG
jgi:hypothetical protein